MLNSLSIRLRVWNIKVHSLKCFFDDCHKIWTLKNLVAYSYVCYSGPICPIPTKELRNYFAYKQTDREHGQIDFTRHSDPIRDSTSVFELRIAWRTARNDRRHGDFAKWQRLATRECNGHELPGTANSNSPCSSDLATGVFDGCKAVWGCPSFRAFEEIEKWKDGIRKYGQYFVWCISFISQ